MKFTKSALNKYISSPLFCGGLYFVTIPLFATIYALSPADWFHYENGSLSNILNSLYFSTITITTLGFGDIYPIEAASKILVTSESILGVLFIGLFLNAIAFRKSEMDAAEEKKKFEIEQKRNAAFKLSRQYVILKPHMENYIDLATIISTPIMNRTGDFKYNPDFKFNELYDLYNPTMRLCDGCKEPAIVHYYKALHDLGKRLESLLANVDLSFWRGLEDNILKLLGVFNDHIYETANLAYIPSPFGSRSLIDAQARLIQNWNKEITYYPSNAINGPVDLYYLIKGSVPLAQKINSQIADVVKINIKQ